MTRNDSNMTKNDFEMGEAGGPELAHPRGTVIFGHFGVIFLSFWSHSGIILEYFLSFSSHCFCHVFVLLGVLPQTLCHFFAILGLFSRLQSMASYRKRQMTKNDIIMTIATPPTDSNDNKMTIKWQVDYLMKSKV